MGAQTKQELEMNGQREEYLEIKDRPQKDRVTPVSYTHLDVYKRQVSILQNRYEKKIDDITFDNTIMI